MCDVRALNAPDGQGTTPECIRGGPDANPETYGNGGSVDESRRNAELCITREEHTRMTHRQRPTIKGHRGSPCMHPPIGSNPDNPDRLFYRHLRPTSPGDPCRRVFDAGGADHPRWGSCTCTDGDPENLRVAGTARFRFAGWIPFQVRERGGFCGNGEQALKLVLKRLSRSGCNSEIQVAGSAPARGR